MRTTRRAGTREIVLLSLTALLLGSALYIFARGSDAPAPTDQSSWAYFLCRDCGEYFHLNGAEMEQALNRREFERAPGGRTLWVKCKKCGQLKGQRAAKCPQHGEIILMHPGPGDPLRCSKCGFRG